MENGKINKEFEPGKVREGERQLHNSESEALAESDRWGKTEEVDITGGRKSEVNSDDEQNASQLEADDDTHVASDFNKNQNKDDDRSTGHTTGVGE